MSHAMVHTQMLGAILKKRNMSEITYLFGAGASKNALPIVNEIPARIKSLIDFLEQEENQILNEVTFEELGIKDQKTDYEYQKEMIQCLKWMLNESENHASIDTFAKKLFIKKAFNDLKILKATMSIFFIFEQARNKPDFRYDAFFASLLSSGITSFPKNIQILSWNYDSQFEISFSAYTDKEDLSTNQSFLGVKSKYTQIDKDSGFSILKLNGTTLLSSERGFMTYNYIESLKGPIDLKFISTVTRSFVAAIYLNNYTSCLSFAWEGEYQESSIIEYAIEKTKSTTTLIIIGYSFPFFNREIDRKIIGAMNNLKRVYIQAPNAEIIKERFFAMRDDQTGIEVITKFDIEQFLLPNEL